MIMRPIPGGGTNAATLQQNARQSRSVLMYRQAFNRPTAVLGNSANGVSFSSRISDRSIFLLTTNWILSRMNHSIACR
jgi:homoserine dehydrogenase